MKNMLKKKRVLFPLIFLGELAIVIIIAIIFDLEMGNSLYGDVTVSITFATFVWFLFRIIKDHKAELSKMRIPLFEFLSVLGWIYFAIVIMIIGLIVNFLVIIFGNIL